MILVKFCDFAKMAFFVNNMAWGTRKYIAIFTKTFPIKNNIWGTEKYVAVFAKAFPINLLTMTSDKHFEGYGLFI